MPGYAPATDSELAVRARSAALELAEIDKALDERGVKRYEPPRNCLRDAMIYTHTVEVALRAHDVRISDGE